MNSQSKSIMSNLEQAHSQDIETITRLLAKISNRSPLEIKPHLNTMLEQLVQSSTEPPFYETATAEEWVTAFREWAASHHHETPPLSDYAVSRSSMYEDERL
ncbi:hypothetical protein [Halotia branconii]|uniref:Uncharacterized protein n=1 Tax=Halotia branconii CENA392 TaxID=1539056 RepID=A0AAJ6NPM2_9CYAN|nr:hypothetical protein [Halotia branconii]WGV24287.1 hypothetical protein QI031_21185 [Halotia branconii CENA392]